MPDITLEDLVRLDDLVRMDACGPARDAFAAQFPDGASYRELLLALAEHPKGVVLWTWLINEADNPFAQEVVNAYTADIEPTWREYRAAITGSILESYNANAYGGVVAQEARQTRDAAFYAAWDIYTAATRLVLRDIADWFFLEGERHG